VTIFEYLTVAVSIVLALGMGQLISSIPHVFDRQKSYWLHALVFVLLVLGHIVIWWRVWLLNDMPTWNIFQFGILMGSPLSLYLAATALVSTNPELVGDWRDHFEAKSQWIFSAFAAIVFFGMFRAYFISQAAPFWWVYVIWGTYVVAAVSKNRGVHIAVVSMTLVLTMYLLSLNFTVS